MKIHIERKKPRKLRIAAVLFTAAALLATGTALYLNSPPAFMQSERFTIEKGESLGSVADKLRRQNLIRSSLFFKSAALLFSDRKIRPGTYMIKKGTSTLPIFYRLAAGDVIMKKVTIPEGFNIYQISERLESEGITTSGDFLIHALDREGLGRLGIDAPSAEGYLFPDTYNFAESSDAGDIISSMNRKMNSVLAQELADAGIRDTTYNRHRTLTLASLIEKEAAVSGERRIISSVFHNRLKNNWRLDCDPTVRYAVKNFDSPIKRSELEAPSPYNTYRNKGLPPGPIANPGRESIKAAISPAETDYFFFVSKNDGSHHFSSSLSEHNRAVRVHQR